MHKYDRVAQEFSKFFNQHYLQEVLNTKADKKIVEKTLYDKASLMDLERCH